MTLQEWLDLARDIRAVYREELGRDVLADPEALINWTYHVRENGRDLDWIRQAVRGSAEWQALHPGPAPSAQPGSALASGGLPSGKLVPIKVTDARDGAIEPRMYSYWANAFVQDSVNALFIFCGTPNGPRFFRVDPLTGAVVRLGPLVPYGGTTEGWRWNKEGHIYLVDGPRLRLVNPFDPTNDRIVVDVSATHPGCDLWQSHSSDDGRVHSATLREVVSEGSYPKVGTLVVRDGVPTLYRAQGVLDESQVTHDGAYVVIKEDDDNRIITVATGEQRVIKDGARALGHSDVGNGFAVGEADKPDPGACVLWDLTTLADPKLLFLTLNMGYVAVRERLCVNSGDVYLNRVNLNVPGLTPILAHGNVNPTGDYDLRVKANLDPSGRWACYISNCGTDRQDVYLLRVG